MITCDNCGKRLPSGLRYCAYCGAPAPAWPVLVLRGYDWRFLSLWCLATAATGALAWLILTHPLVAGLQTSGQYPVIAVTVAALVAGAAQWLVLRTRPVQGRGTAWWLLALPLGWGLAYSLSSFWPQMGENVPQLPILLRGLLPLTLLAGLGTTLQWPLARQYAWPASRWILAAMAALGLVAFLGALTSPAERGGWFAALALQLPSKPGITDYDLGMAALLGAVLGAAQFLPVRRAAPGAVFWPVVLAGAGVLAAAILDGVLIAASAIYQAATGQDAVALMAILTQGSGGALAWAILGLSLGIGQWLVLRLSQKWVPRLTPALSAGPLPERADPRWVPLTTGGYLLAWPVAWVLLPWGWLLLGSVVAGLITGVPQWLSLRGQFAAAAWLPAGAAAGWGILVLLSQVPGVPILGWPTGLMILVAVLSLASGMLLARR
jgi:hypothetical protein